jgi:hypothetical protein
MRMRKFLLSRESDSEAMSFSKSTCAFLISSSGFFWEKREKMDAMF